MAHDIDVHAANENLPRMTAQFERPHKMTARLYAVPMVYGINIVLLINTHPDPNSNHNHYQNTTVLLHLSVSRNFGPKTLRH